MSIIEMIDGVVVTPKKHPVAPAPATTHAEYLAAREAFDLDAEANAERYRTAKEALKVERAAEEAARVAAADKRAEQERDLVDVEKALAATGTTALEKEALAVLLEKFLPIVDAIARRAGETDRLWERRVVLLRALGRFKQERRPTAYANARFAVGSAFKMKLLDAGHPAALELDQWVGGR